MIYLLPFLNAFLLYICLEEKQILNKVYVWIVSKTPFITQAIIGGCILCTAFWMGFIELNLIGIIKEISIYNKALLIFYNAIATAILYRLMK